MFSVALVGPDGSGKTTICQRLLESFALPTKYVYMGVNTESSNVMLPTTYVLRGLKRLIGATPDRDGPRDLKSVRRERPRGAKGVLRGAKAALLLANRVAEEWFRQGLTWYYQRRGYIVLFDRHYFADYYSYDIAPSAEPRPLLRRLHGLMLRRVFPKPDLTIYLDAPSDVLLARKGEGTAEILEERRRAYLEMGPLLPNFTRVDASQPQERVLAEVSRLILAHYEQRKRV